MSSLTGILIIGAGKVGTATGCLPKDILAIAEIDNLGFFKKISEINNILRKI
jgi:hypothetical protein